MEKLKERITENGIDYILVGDYYIPDLKLPEENAPSDAMGGFTGNISNRSIRHGTAPLF